MRWTVTFLSRRIEDEILALQASFAPSLLFATQNG
jgi:hypothetical protein